MRSKLYFIAVLGLAVGIPYAYYQGADYWKAKLPRWLRPSAAASGDPSVPSVVSIPSVGSPSASVKDAAPIVDIAEVFRFDITPGWVIQRWPLVSTGMGQIQLEGFRVPVFTGTAEDDIAGTLTYYFDPHQRPHRIAFFGTTGDPKKLLELLTRQFGFERNVLNDPSIVVYEVPVPKPYKPASTLKIEPMPVVSANDPLRRFQISLVLERPAR